MTYSRRLSLVRTHLRACSLSHLLTELVACFILGSSIWGKDKVLHEDVFAAKEEEEEEPAEIAKPGSVVFKKVCE